VLRVQGGEGDYKWRDEGRKAGRGDRVRARVGRAPAFVKPQHEPWL